MSETHCLFDWCAGLTAMVAGMGGVGIMGGRPLGRPAADKKQLSS